MTAMVADDKYPYCLGAEDPEENGVRKAVN